MLAGRKFTVTRMAPADISEIALPGSLLALASALYLRCADAWIELVEIQLEGKRSMSAADFLRGNALPVGARLD
jgi:methionyl-tRNA formyltransferase